MGHGQHLVYKLLLLCLELVPIHISVGVKIHHRRSMVNRSSNDSKIFKGACSIIITFISLVVIPNTVMLILVSVDPEVAYKYMEIIYCFSNFNYLVDPIIYLWKYERLSNRVTRSVLGNTKPDLLRTVRACEGHA